MPETLAIQLNNVSKIYRLHGSQKDQLIDVLGLQRLGIRPKNPAREFIALSDINLDVPSGHRIGIIGRNGAGKSTLLKLICGNYAPSHGEITVNGTVQALMSMGLGFHPEYTGRENAETSLLYNGLTRNEYEKAMVGIVEFCELGEFLDQPFKTYSLGMQARLMFATATAVRPDILIVDEVLGAGDAYFVAKSKIRVEQLVNSGCTMLLVSHSMQQILELCTEVIWLDAGQIRMRGEAFMVVKAYEEYMHGPIVKISAKSAQSTAGDTGESDTDLKDMSDISLQVRPAFEGIDKEIRFQEPKFIPHEYEVELAGDNLAGFRFEAPGGISRWESETGIKVAGFSVETERGTTDTLVVMRPARFVINLLAEVEGTYNCRYGIALHDHLGVCMTRIYSPCDSFSIMQGETRRIEIMFNPCQIGPGEYTVGIAVFDYEPLEKLNSSRRYDLLSRSFVVKVELPDTLSVIDSRFVHSAEWSFASMGQI